MKAARPTHIFARYPHPKSLPSGKGLAVALVGSKSGVSQMRNVSNTIKVFAVTNGIDTFAPILIR